MIPSRRASATGQGPALFAEAPAWRSIGDGWRPLFGNVRELGFSIEWHDFQTRDPLDWGRSFHPGTLELCLNLTGSAQVDDGSMCAALGDRTFTFYRQGTPALTARRGEGMRHTFVTVEYAPEFLRRHFADQSDNLHPMVRGMVKGEETTSGVALVERLGMASLTLVDTLRHPPVFAPAQAIWFQSKAVELAAQFFFRPPEGELFCTRTQRLARERVDQVQAILRANLSEPPSLDELGRQVGCSPYYLSRLFSQEAGMTIQQFLREVRMERAAELLRTGQCNVTEAALEVGYNSLSHFSSTFQETFDCSPGLYPPKPKE